MSVFLLFLAILFEISTCVYVVPNPKIQVYRKGFSVSVPHDEGITVFAFHGNINRHMRGLEAGQFSTDILAKTGNRWEFTDYDTTLKTGDVIYYWLFVIRNGLGHRYDNGVHIVQEILPGQPSNLDREKSDASCLHRLDLFNLTKNIISLQNEVENLRQTNEIMMDIVDGNHEKLHSLKFTGVLPPFNDSLQLVQDILRDKLGSKVKAEQAKRNSDQSISFTVKDLKDKISVIASAKEKLKNSKIGISY